MIGGGGGVHICTVHGLFSQLTAIPSLALCTDVALQCRCTLLLLTPHTPAGRNSLTAAAPSLHTGRACPRCVKQLFHSSASVNQSLGWFSHASVQMLRFKGNLRLANCNSFNNFAMLIYKAEFFCSREPWRQCLQVPGCFALTF